ncbi:MAG: terminase small subunit [Coriobacteriales bacterium]|jgi:hypothetical protein|nr:terminase small subunit [Coriobacteriales bacterium]
MADNNLTPKQSAFADAVVSGMSYSDAYRSAYDCEASSPVTINRRAAELMANSKIKARVEEGTEQALKDAIWNHEAAIDRMVCVNDTACNEMLRDGLSNRERNQTFFWSADRLGAMTGLEPLLPLRRL